MNLALLSRLIVIMHHFASFPQHCLICEPGLTAMVERNNGVYRAIFISNYPCIKSIFKCTTPTILLIGYLKTVFHGQLIGTLADATLQFDVSFTLKS